VGSHRQVRRWRTRRAPIPRNVDFAVAVTTDAEAEQLVHRLQVRGEDQVVKQAAPVEVLPGFVVPVAAVGYLIALRLLARDDARRPNDLADLNALLAVAAPEEIELARTAVTTITERGFNRDRDLQADLAALISSRRPQ
jgi:hypothetical protein